MTESLQKPLRGAFWIMASLVAVTAYSGCGEVVAPAVATVTPQAALPGASVTVVGTGLENHDVTVGNVPARVKTRRADSVLVVELPKKLKPGTYSLVVAGEGDEASSNAVKVSVLDIVTVASGTPLHVRVTEGIQSGRSLVGTAFSLVLEQPLVVNGRTVAAAGSEVIGRVNQMEEAGRVKGRAEIGFTLVQLKPNARAYTIETDNALVQAGGTKMRDAVTIGGGAGVGAVVGGILGGKKGAVIGAGAGGAAGTGVALATQGKEIEILPGALFTLHLRQAVDIQMPEVR